MMSGEAQAEGGGDAEHPDFILREHKRRHGNDLERRAAPW
jgi:hypothetical protein